MSLRGVLVVEWKIATFSAMYQLYNLYMQVFVFVTRTH